MRLWAVLSSAAAGWRMILVGEEGWRDRFGLGAAGLVTALAIFAFLAFLAVAFASMSIGMPNAAGVIAAMFVLALPVTALVVSLLGTRMALRSDVPLYDVMVPGTYALSAFLVVEGFLAMIGGPVVMFAWLGLGYLLFRLARAASTWSLGVAGAFAVLTVVLLVAMRLALYMLTSPASSPI